jgi:glycosyltransferase involved in cell wall biosynthesis
MNYPKISAHMLIKNEQRWVWYSIMSVINFVDEILIWDMGSTDATVEIVKSIHSPKIKFKEVGDADIHQFTQLRQKMLDQTEADWLLIVDGDEVWFAQVISELINTIKTQGYKYEYLVSRYYTLVGDVFHYQEKSAAGYHIGPFSGHIGLRAINLKKIPGLHFALPHGQQGIFDADNRLIQNRPQKEYRIMTGRYFHLTHLPRSITLKEDARVSKRSQKYKYELGIPFPSGFVFPRVFYMAAPPAVPFPWWKRNLLYIINAAWQTPLKMLKRRLVTTPSGYSL